MQIDVIAVLHKSRSFPTDGSLVYSNRIRYRFLGMAGEPHRQRRGGSDASDGPEPVQRPGHAVEARVRRLERGKRAFWQGGAGNDRVGFDSWQVWRMRRLPGRLEIALGGFPLAILLPPVLPLHSVTVVLAVPPLSI